MAEIQSGAAGLRAARRREKARGNRRTPAVPSALRAHELVPSG